MASSEVRPSSCGRRLASGRDDLVPNDSTCMNNGIMRAVDQIAKGAGRLGLPLYSCASSKRTYTQHQLLVLVVLRQLMARSYRGLVDIVATMSPLLWRLRLDRMPHFTTLQKFSLRIELEAIERVLAAIAASATGDALVVAVDSTGLRETSASYYFMRTMSLRRDSSGTEERRVGRHLKHTVAVSTATLMILASSSAPGPGADADKLVPVLDKLRGLGVAAVVGDKGYDSESNRRFVVHELGAEAHIPLRRNAKWAGEQHGRYRRRQLAAFDQAIYDRRPLSETTHASEKRTMDDLVRARLPDGKRNEVAERDLAYNARRAAALEGG